MDELHLTRRRFLAGSLLASLGAVAAACIGGPTASPTARGSPSPPPTARPGASPAGAPQRATGPLTIAGRGTGRSAVTSVLAGFEDDHAVVVIYAASEADDDEAFVATIRPQLEQGVDPGWDMLVLSDWMAAHVISQGWAHPIDAARVPAAVRNLRDEGRNPSWDPDNGHAYPWIGYAVGVAFHREAAGRELTRVADLFEPDLAGAVTLPADPRDTLPMIHLLRRAQGAATHGTADSMTVEDARAAVELLRPFVDSGHVRGFTTPGDIGGLAEGTDRAALVRSQEVASLLGEAHAFAFPVEGWLSRWHHVVIPRAARNASTAELAIDWLYDPQHAARLAVAVHGISPVQGAASALDAIDNAPEPEAPMRLVLVPPASVAARRHTRPIWDEETAEEVGALYAGLVGTAARRA